MKKQERVRIIEGEIGIIFFDTAEELSDDAKERHPELKDYGLIYGNYEPDPTYISYGKLYLSKESSPGLIAHEIYHAVRHIARVKSPGLFGDKDGKLSRHQDMKEEREADMFGQLFNTVWEMVTGNKA